MKKEGGRDEIMKYIEGEDPTKLDTQCVIKKYLAYFKRKEIDGFIVDEVKRVEDKEESEHESEVS